jgi:hypothetical protein
MAKPPKFKTTEPENILNINPEKTEPRISKALMKISIFVHTSPKKKKKKKRKRKCN